MPTEADRDQQKFMQSIVQSLQRTLYIKGGTLKVNYCKTVLLTIGFWSCCFVYNFILGDGAPYDGWPFFGAMNLLAFFIQGYVVKQVNKKYFVDDGYRGEFRLIVR